MKSNFIRIAGLAAVLGGLYLLIGLANLVGLIRGALHHLLGQTLGNQFVWVVLIHQSPVGTLDLRVADITGYIQDGVGILESRLLRRVLVPCGVTRVTAFGLDHPQQLAKQKFWHP